MDVCKHFLAGVINVSLSEVHIIIRDTISASPRLLHYVKYLEDLKYEDGKYHVYFGEVKQLVYSFSTFWGDTMDEVLRETDGLMNTRLSVNDLISHIDQAISRRSAMIQLFERDFLPIETLEQQQIYDEIRQKNHADTEGLCDLKKVVETLDQQGKRDLFAKTEFPKAVRVKNNVFEYAYTYICMLLADRLPEIEGSLKDITQRLRKNTATLQRIVDEEVYYLLMQLYERNWEKMMMYRCGCASSDESVAVEMSIDKIRNRVIERSSQGLYNQLEEESVYYNDKLREFQRIASTLRKVKAEYETVEREKAMYQSMSSTELPGSKLETWRAMGLQFEKRSQEIRDSLIKAAKTLMTFFCVRGPLRANYVDNIGEYHIDEHGHQVYHYESGLRELHVDCNRNFKEKKNEERYFYDAIGRYLKGDKGQRLYQVQTCTSSYEIGEDTLLKKVTVDCGHSEIPNKDCGMKIKDLTDDTEILPKTDPVNISKTMAPETTRYLWEALGGVLPAALRDVGTLRPKNPVHYLAHRLLAHKYSRTKPQLRQKRQEAESYRADIMKERKDKAAAESRAWKAKQTPRRKPEESDGAHEWAAYTTYVATQDFIQSLNSYYD